MIVKLTGGLGNQIFSAAFGFSTAMARGEELFFDKSGYENETLRHYELDAYDLPMKFENADGRFVFQEQSAAFDPHVYEQPAGTCFKGYWQDEGYFNAPLVRKLFVTPKGMPNGRCYDLAERILGTRESCFIGVRRADYLWPERINYHGVMPKEYYTEALSLLPRELLMLAFTDDIPWVKENLPPNVLIVDVNGPNEKAWDIWLMSLCTHGICANSTFHWIGAWLQNDTGKVICPKRWFADEEVNKACSIVPDRWVRI